MQRKNHTYKVRLLLVLLVIGCKSSTRFLSQSQIVAIAIDSLLSAVT